MPNWCEGTLKVRGKTENVKKFLTEGINQYVYDWEKKDTIKQPKDFMSVEHSHGYTEIDFAESAHIDDTYRAFVDPCSVYIDDEREPSCVALPFRQAWSIHKEDFEKLSELYEVDFRLYGAECGMGFVQEITVENGKATQDDWTEYEDWTWECPFPYLGG